MWINFIFIGIYLLEMVRDGTRNKTRPILSENMWILLPERDFFGALAIFQIFYNTYRSNALKFTEDKGLCIAWDDLAPAVEYLIYPTAPWRPLTPVVPFLRFLEVCFQKQDNC